MGAICDEVVAPDMASIGGPKAGGTVRRSATNDRAWTVDAVLSALRDAKFRTTRLVFTVQPSCRGRAVMRRWPPRKPYVDRSQRPAGCIRARVCRARWPHRRSRQPGRGRRIREERCLLSGDRADLSNDRDCEGFRVSADVRKPLMQEPAATSAGYGDFGFRLMSGLA